MENFIIGPMTPWGPFATGFVGLLCAFVLYGLIMKYPAGKGDVVKIGDQIHFCLLYTSPSPRDKRQSRMPSSA